jgi:hypothetical protein
MYFKPHLSSIQIQTSNRWRDFFHWDPRSEQYATTGHLYSAIRRGWEVYQYVVIRTHYFSGGRKTQIYYFDLRNGDHKVTMPVIENPALVRLVYSEQFITMPYSHYETLAATVS